MNTYILFTKKYFIINCVFIVFAITYFGAEILFKQAFILPILLIISLFISLVINTFFLIKKYYNDFKYFFISIVSIMIVLSFGLLSEDKHVSASAMIFFAALLVEIKIMVSLLNIKNRKHIIIYVAVIIFVGAISRVFNIVLTYDTIFSFLLFLYVIIVINIIFNENINVLSSIINNQDAILKDNEEIYEELSEAQERMKKDNIELIKKGKEIEDAYESLNRVNAEMFIQNELLRYISSTLDMEQLMDLVTDSIVGALGVDTCSLLIFDHVNQQHNINVKTNLPLKIEEEIAQSLLNFNLDEYIDLQHTFLDSNVSENKYSFINNRKVGSLIIVPLIQNGGLYGVLIAEKLEKSALNEDSIQFFEGIATQINISISNAQMYLVMEDMANKDGLTKLYNRRYVQLQLYDLFNKAKKSGQLLTAVLLDIDFFKKVNDTYGHLFGDEALKMVASKIMEICDKYNLIGGRYGGEEFVIIGQGISREKIIHMMEEMHENIKNEELIYEESTIVKINCSIGIAIYPDIATTADQLLNRADNAMYYSKMNGRGRISLDSIELDN